MGNLIQNIISKGQKARPELDPSLLDKCFRWISKYVSFTLLKIGLAPNSVTLLAIIFSIIGGCFLTFGTDIGYIYASLSFFLFLLFDYCDGEMARYLNQTSMDGHYLDYMAHFIMFASFMIGLTYGIYRYHSTSIYLILGFCGVAGILLRSIAVLLISEIVVRENLRLQRRLPMSNKNISYSLPSTTVNSICIKSESISLMKKFIRVLLWPNGGDSILFFYIPFTIIIYLFPFPIINKWNIRIIDIYFIYLCSINFLLPFLLIYRNIQKNRIEIAYDNIFNDYK